MMSERNGVVRGFFVWLRVRLGTCQMGSGLRGCWRRPAMIWSLDDFSVPLCAEHAYEMDGLLGRLESL